MPVKNTTTLLLMLYRTAPQLEVAAHELLDAASKGPWFVHLIPGQQDIDDNDTRSVVVRNCKESWIAVASNLNLRCGLPTPGYWPAHMSLSALS